MYYVPSPDYRGYSQSVNHPTSFEVPENLIPPPDYARYEPQIDYEMPPDYERGRPRLPNNTRKVEKVQREEKKAEEPVMKQIIVPPIVEKPKEVREQNTEEKMKPLIVDTSPSPQLYSSSRFEGQPRRNYQEHFAVHSYLEDRDKLETDDYLNESTRSHIRSIGVPVLPPIGRENRDFFGPAQAQNKAFIRHLENHRKFDTMKSLKSCKDCPLCQMMMGSASQNEGEEQARNRRPHVREMFEEDNAIKCDWAMARRSYIAQAADEISVGFREKVQIIQKDGTHAFCRKSDGQTGRLPLHIVPFTMNS